MKEYSCNHIKVIIKRGDITEEETDAIVNPANSYMIMGGGVALAIKRKGGEIIEREAIKQAPVKVGEAISTTAGKLKTKYVIHAPTMEKPAQRISIKNVEKACLAALRKAEELKIKSISFPALGAGVGGISAFDSAKTMITVIKNMRNKLSLEKIVLVAWSNKDYDEFIRAADSLLE